MNLITKIRVNLWLIKNPFLPACIFLCGPLPMAQRTPAAGFTDTGIEEAAAKSTPAGKYKISVNPVILSNFSSCLCAFCAFLWLKNPFNQRNLRLMNYLHAFGIFTTVESALQIRLFMQNEPKFRKSQMIVNKVLTKDYENKTLGEHGKNEPKTNPIKPNSKPIRPKTNPIQTQTNPISRPSPGR